MTAQKRLWAIFILFSFLFSVGFFISLRMEHMHLLKLQQMEIKARKGGFEKVLELNAQAIFLLAKDYSYWDELVQAIKNEDQEWGKVNIDSGIKTYQADGAWVYDMNLKWIYSVNKFVDDRIKTLPLDKAQIKRIFGQKALVHFFVETPAGYLELLGATVHPSNDVERKTVPQGYIFAGKLWNSDYLALLSELAGTSVSVVPPQSTVKVKLPQENFLIPVNDWQEKALFDIVGQVNSEEIKSFQNYSQLLLKVFILYTVIQMLVVFYFLRRFFKEIQRKS